MKRLFLSAALLPLVHAASAYAETKISTATTTPVATATAASGQPDDITIDTAGSIAPTVSGAAVTVNSSNVVTNNGTISLNNVSAATGVLVNGGVATTVTNAGAINLVEDYTATDTDNDGYVEGPFAQGSGRYGIRAVGAAVTGNVVNSGTIQIEGNDSAGVSLETRLQGALTSSGTIIVTGDRNFGVRADSVSGDVTVSGAITMTGGASVGVQVGQVDGGLVLSNAILSTGYRTTSRSTTAAESTLDSDDTLQGGSAVRVLGSVGRGILLNTGDTSSALTVYGGAPALDIGSAGSDITLGAVGTDSLAFGLVNLGTISVDGVHDGIASTGVRVGQAGGGTVTVAGGISNTGSIGARAYAAQANGVILNAGARVTTFVNAGTVGAEQIGGLSDARALTDLSGTLALVRNSGAIRAVVTPGSGVTQTGRAIAIDLSANNAGAVVSQTTPSSGTAPSIVGDVLFGTGADRLELLGGTLNGGMSFGGGADTLVIDGGASASGQITTPDGQLAIAVNNGRLAVTNTSPLTIASLSIGQTGELAVRIDPAANTTRFNVTGAATLASGAKVDVILANLSRGTRSYQILQAGSLTVGQTEASVAGAPYLYLASLRADTSAGGLYVDLRPKTASELGLNRSGAEAYSAVFDSLDKDASIEAAFLGQTSASGFQSLYDQMLPEHSGGLLMSAQAASSAVSQAAAAPMRIDAGSGTATWAQEIVFNISRDKTDAQGFTGKGFGFAAGADLLGDGMALGANVSFVTADVRDKTAEAGEQVTMNIFGAGLHWRLDGGPLQATARAGLGYAFLTGDRRLVASGLDLKAKADWGAWMADAYAGVSYEARLGPFYARPELSTTYVRLAEDGYSEKGGGDGFDLTVDKRTEDILSGQALLTLGWRMGDETYLAPELKAGYRARIAGGPSTTTAHFSGGADFTLDPENVSKGGVIVRAGLRGGGAKVLYAIDGGTLFDSHYKEYDVRGVIRFQF